MVAEYRPDLLPQQGPEEHAVWTLPGDVLIMRVTLVGFNYVELGGEDAVPPQLAGSSKGGPSDSRGQDTSPTLPLATCSPSGASVSLTRGCHGGNVTMKIFCIRN